MTMRVVERVSESRYSSETGISGKKGLVVAVSEAVGGLNAVE